MEWIVLKKIKKKGKFYALGDIQCVQSPGYPLGWRMGGPHSRSGRNGKQQISWPMMELEIYVQFNSQSLNRRICST